MKNKKCFFCILLCFLGVIFYACGTHVEEYALMKKYKVKSQTVFEKSGEKSEYNEFDVNGHVVQEDRFETGICRQHRTSVYDSLGHILSISETLSSDQKLTRTYEKYTCDTNGHPLSAKKYNADNAELLYTSDYTYDKDGNCTLISMKNPSGKEEWRYGSTFDRNGNPVSLNVYSALQGWEKPWRTKTLEYDGNGNLVKIVHYLEPGKVSGHFEKQYDDRGLLKSFSFYDSENKVQREAKVTYTYYP